MLIYELSDVKEMDVSIVKSPPKMLWTFLSWDTGHEIVSSPEQSVEDFILQKETDGDPLLPILSRNDPDFLVEMDKGQIHDNYIIIIDGRLTYTRLPDQALGLREVSYEVSRGDDRQVNKTPTSIMLDGLTSIVALEPSKHGCLTINDMDDYDYDGSFRRIDIDAPLLVSKSSGKTWIFVMDGLIVIDETPYFEANFVELLEDETVESLENDSIVLVLHRLG
jgi:hypothetical protein